MALRKVGFRKVGKGTENVQYLGHVHVDDVVDVKLLGVDPHPMIPPSTSRALALLPH